MTEISSPLPEISYTTAKKRSTKTSKLQQEQRKKQQVQSSFITISNAIVILSATALFYTNYLMVIPIISSIFWAFLWAIFLSTPHNILLMAFEYLDARVGQHYTKAVGLAFICWFLVSVIFPASLFNQIVTTSCFVLFVSLLYIERKTLSSILVLLISVIMVILPLFFALRTALWEIGIISSNVQSAIAENTELQKLFEDFGNSSQYLWLKNTAESWGYELPEFPAKARELLTSAALSITQNLTTALSGVFSLVSDISNKVLNVFTFFSVLQMLLERKKSITQLFAILSPFPTEDNDKLMKKIKESTGRVFYYSFFLGLIHFIVSYLSFSLSGFDLSFSVSLLCGFFSMVPVVSSLIVFVPVCLGIFISGNKIGALLCLFIQLLTLLFVDNLILSNFFPGGNSFFIGMSLVMGIYAFGLNGLLIGPICSGLTFTFIDLYLCYSSMDLFEQQQDVTATGTTGTTFGQQVQQQASSITTSTSNAFNSFTTSTSGVSHSALNSIFIPLKDLFQFVAHPFHHWTPAKRRTASNDESQNNASFFSDPGHNHKRTATTSTTAAVSKLTAAKLTTALRERKLKSPKQTKAKQKQQVQFFEHKEQDEQQQQQQQKQQSSCLFSPPSLAPRRLVLETANKFHPLHEHKEQQ